MTAVSVKMWTLHETHQYTAQRLYTFVLETSKPDVPLHITTYSTNTG